VSGRISTKTGFAPRKTNALAVEVKVNEGRMISSPCRESMSIAAISKAAVHDVVSSTFFTPSSLCSSA
jgi:hypothetical protein